MTISSKGKFTIEKYAQNSISINECINNGLLMKKMLMIVPEYPFPCKCGMTVRIGDMCRNINDIVEIHLFVCNPIKGSNPLDGKELFKSISLAPVSVHGNCFYEILQKIFRKITRPLFDSSIYVGDDIIEFLSAMQRKNAYDIVMVHTPLLSRTLKAFPRNVFRIIDPHDIWYQRYYEFMKIKKGKLLTHFRNLGREMELYQNVDLVLAISLWDRDFMVSHGINPIHVPVSFKTEPLPERNPPGANILYASGSGYANVDAIHYFVNEIFPSVKKNIPEAKFIISNACDELKEEYSCRKDIMMLSYLNNVREAYLLADIVVIPLRIGTGLKIKVLESMSFGKPTILSATAARGIEIEDYLQEQLSDRSEIIADEIIRVFKDESYRRNLSSSGLLIIEKCYNPSKVYGDLRSILQK